MLSELKGRVESGKLELWRTLKQSGLQSHRKIVKDPADRTDQSRVGSSVKSQADSRVDPVCSGCV